MSYHSVTKTALKIRNRRKIQADIEAADSMMNNGIYNIIENSVLNSRIRHDKVQVFKSGEMTF